MADTDNGVVLVADGDPKVLEDVSSTLEKAGYTVLTALGSAPVLAVCGRPQPVRLAILDLAMSGSGPELVEKIYQSCPGVRILFTANTDQSEAVRQIGRSGQVRDFLRKPFRRSQLLGHVLQVLDAPMVHTA